MTGVIEYAVGSQAPVFEDCIVEIVAQLDHVQYIITNSLEAVSSLHESIRVPGNNAVLQYPSRSVSALFYYHCKFCPSRLLLLPFQAVVIA